MRFYAVIILYDLVYIDGIRFGKWLLIATLDNRYKKHSIVISVFIIIIIILFYVLSEIKQQVVLLLYYSKQYLLFLGQLALSEHYSNQQIVTCKPM